MEHRNDAAQPDYIRPELKTVLPDLDLMEDLIAGTRRMHERAMTYIRKWTDEDQQVYLIRSKSEQVFEGTTRTLSASIGMLFAKEPELEWNESETALSEDWDNIDGEGTKGHVFVKRFAEVAVRDGLGIILVDHPSPPRDRETGEPVRIHGGNERALNMRPMWAYYPRKLARSWRFQKIDNKKTLTQLVLAEPTVVDEGIYGVAHRERYRVLRLINGEASWTLYEKRKEANVEKFVILESGHFRNKKGQVADFIPVAIGYTGRTDAPMVAQIPLLGVAWANLGHWQIASNLRFYTDLCCFPQPTIVGTLAMEPGIDEAGNKAMVPGHLRVGPMVVVHLMGDGASYDFTAPPVEAFVPIEKRLLEKEQAMGKLGMSFLVTDTRAAETAEAKRLDATAENSTLATAAQGIDDAINLAWEHHCWFYGIEKASAPVFAINRDFESIAMDAATMTVYVKAVKDAGLPERLLLEAWKSGGRLPPDTDIDEILFEMMANRAAEEEREREMAELNAQEEEVEEEEEGGVAA